MGVMSPRVFTREKSLPDGLLLKWVDGTLAQIKAHAAETGSEDKIADFTRNVKEIYRLETLMNKPIAERTNVAKEVADFRQLCAETQVKYLSILNFHSAHPRFNWPITPRTHEYHFYAFQGVTVLAHLQASGASGWSTSTPYEWRLGLQEGNLTVRRALLQFALEEPGQPGLMLVDSQPLLDLPLGADPVEIKVVFTYLPELQPVLYTLPREPVKLPSRMECAIVTR